MIKWKRENIKILASSIHLQNQPNSVLFPKATGRLLLPRFTHPATKTYQEDLPMKQLYAGRLSFQYDI